jgi:hypothetical protein
MDSVTVYWSYIGDQDFTSGPLPIRHDVFQKNIENSYFYSCPAFKDSIRNVFTFKVNKEKHISLEKNQLLDVYNNPKNSDRYTEGIPVADNLYSIRDSSLNAHVNLLYGHSWIFFADQPLVARFTAPYSPPTSPTPGAMLAQGEFDIGNWYRSFNLEYFVPNTATEWNYNFGDPIFFVEFKTDKKIIFKEYDCQGSESLVRIEDNLVSTLDTMPIGSGLTARYKMFKQNKIKNKILSEIQKVTKA